MPFCVSSHPLVDNGDFYKKYDSVDDVLSVLNVDELIQNGGFFDDRAAINYSLEQAKENEVFNAVMMGKAYLSVSGDYVYTNKPIVNQIDIANIIAIKSSRFLQKEIDKGNQDYVTAGSVLDQLIVKELTGVSISDINQSDWVNKNPLTKAMKSCIGDNYDQADINTIISDRVIQYYQYKMEKCAALDLDDYVKRLTAALMVTVFECNAGKITSANRGAFYQELRGLGDKPASQHRNGIHITNYI